MTFPHISLYIYININIYIIYIYTSPSPPHFFSGNFPWFFLVSPKTELDSKSDRLTVTTTPRLVILFDSDYHASRLAPADSYDRTGARSESCGEIRWGKWKRKKIQAILLWKTWNNTCRNPRFLIQKEESISKNYGGSRFYSWSPTSICARNWWCWPFTIDRAVTSSV